MADYNIAISFFASGKPVPDLLTEEEAITFLRLDGDDGPKNPSITLKYYRDKHLLKAVNVGKHNRYLKTELLRFLDAKLKEEPKFED